MSVNLNVEQIKRLQAALKDQATDMSDIQYELENALNSTMYVSAYAVTRHYGGPAEGGDWYNAGELIDSLETTLVEAEGVRSQLEEKHKEVAHGNIYSVLGGVELQVSISDEPGADWPQGPYRYE